jgi:hypothetical protein
MRLVLPPQHGASNLDATVNRQQKPLAKLVASNQISIACTHGQGMGMRAQIRTQSGASRTQKVQPPALIRSPAKMGRYRCDKKANENGESYRPGPQNQQLNNQVNEGATILFGR